MSHGSARADRGVDKQAHATRVNARITLLHRQPTTRHTWSHHELSSGLLPCLGWLPNSSSSASCPDWYALALRCAALRPSLSWAFFLQSCEMGRTLDIRIRLLAFYRGHVTVGGRSAGKLLRCWLLADRLLGAPAAVCVYLPKNPGPSC